MLESLVSLGELRERPYIAFVWALVICSIAIIISLQVSPSITGIDFGYFSVLFTIIPSVYMLTLIIKKEEFLEEEEIKKYHKKSFWGRHEMTIFILLFYFAGLTFTFSLWSFILPENSFQAQITKINQIQGTTGGFLLSRFWDIFTNNIQVMAFSFIFSFIFGAGGVFIIVWNASVLGVYIGQISKAFWQIPIVSISFLPHGIPEIGAYLLAGLAGGIVSAAIIRKNPSSVLKIIVLDSLKILLLAILLLLAAAVVEVSL